MKTSRVLIAVAVVCGVLLATPAFAAPSAACRKNGKIAFAAWTQGLYSQVGQHFSSEVKVHLPPDVLREMWEQLQAQVGKFESLGQFEPRMLDGHAMMVASMKFESRNMAALFSCNAKGEITGLQVLDPTSVAGLKALVPSSH